METGALVPADLRCERLVEPMVVDAPAPRFCWRLSGDGFERRQTAYRLAVHGPDGAMWDSGRIESAETLGIAYEGAPLLPLTRYDWRVTSWDEAGRESETVASAFETGLMGAEWRAPWICVPPSRGAKPPEATLAYRNPFRALNVSYLRRGFTVPAGVRKARLYATALGTYRFFIDGRRVGDDLLTPSFTDYHTRVEYQAYDVTGLIGTGETVISALLGEGWYSGYLGLDAKRPAAIWGRKPQLSAFLVLTHEDGRETRIETDGTWRHALGGLIYSDMLKGEKFDARLEPEGWHEPGFDDRHWERAGLGDGPGAAALSAPLAPPVRVTREIAARSVERAPDGAYVFDLGQNMVGTVEARFAVRRDQTVRLVHAEMLDADGNLYLDNLRTANQEDIYIGASDGVVIYRPTFTFHGFRYVGIYGLDAPPALDAVRGIVVNNDLPETARFATSSPLLDQLQSNILWSQRGNFVSVPTDCPQRDERLGWTADGQVFAPTAAWNMDISAFFAKWMRDIVDSQSNEGAFGDVAPRVTQTADGAPAWGDAGVILPLLLHERYGDRRPLEASYGPMKRWIEYIRAANPTYLRTNRNNNNYGDWLAIGQQTPNDLVATAYYAWLAELMARAARILGIREDAAYYAELRAAIAEAFAERYLAADGRIESGSQTAYLIALFAGLVPEPLVAAAVGHLVANIEANGRRIAIGFLGVRHICPVLTQHGHAELAYHLATSTEFPSWGYSIVNGATTIWERWDGWTEEHGFQVPNMNSFNHYAYGSVGEWMFEWMGGIAPDPQAPGFAHFFLRPTPGGDIGSCRIGYDSARGPIRSEWERLSDRIRYRFEIPANTRATLELMADAAHELVVNGEAVAPDVVETRHGTRRAVLTLGSGVYEVDC